MRLARATYGESLDQRTRGRARIAKLPVSTKPRPVFKHGDQVTLKNFYLSDWIPRIPGELWKQEIFGGTRRLDDLTAGDFFNPNKPDHGEREHQVSQTAKNWIEAACARHSDGVAMAAGIRHMTGLGRPESPLLALDLSDCPSTSPTQTGSHV